MIRIAISSLLFIVLSACGGSDFRGFRLQTTGEITEPDRPQANLPMSLQISSITPDQLFDWAEATYPQLFPSKEITRQASIYHFRYYPETNTYLGVENGFRVAALGQITANQLVYFGTLKTFEQPVLEWLESMQFRAQLFLSPTPDYSALKASPLDGFSIWEVNPSNVNIIGLDGKNRIFAFPSYQASSALGGACKDQYCPLLGAVELIETSSNIFTLARVIPDVNIGVARAWAYRNNKRTRSKEFVVVDHGLEPNRINPIEWPHGFVWSAQDDGAGFKFQKISSVRAFNHSVATGDINGDGLDDLAVTTMGSKRSCFGLLSTNPELFLAQADQRFSEDAPCVSSPRGGSAVAIADVLGTGKNQIITAYYMPSLSMPDDKVAIDIMTGNSSASLKVSTTINRDGLFNLMGATQIIPFDFNQDGKLDLLVSLESFSGENGFEVYKNLGDGKFIRATEGLVKNNRWSFSNLQYREIAIADVNFDGYPDIILNGWNGSLFKLADSTSLDIGALIFLNRKGMYFENPQRTSNSHLRFASTMEWPLHLRFMDSDAESRTFRFFGFKQNGTPMVIRVSLGSS